MKYTKSYFKTFVLLLLTFVISSCKKDYTNNELYEIQIGQTFDFYLAENSCCINCWLNETSLTSIKLVEKKLVDSARQDCDGCTSLYAWVFKGITAGKDTIKIARIGAGQSCTDYKEGRLVINPDIIIVNVTK